MSGKYSQKPLDHAKQSAADGLTTSSKKVIEKTAEATGVWLVITLPMKLQKNEKFLHR